MYIRARLFIIFCHAIAFVSGVSAIAVVAAVALKWLSLESSAEIIPIGWALYALLFTLCRFFPPVYWIAALLPDPTTPEQTAWFFIVSATIFLALCAVVANMRKRARTGTEIIRDLLKARQRARIEGKRVRQSQSIGDVTGNNIHIQQTI